MGLKANGYILKNRDGTIQVLVNWAKSKPEFAEAGYDSAVSAFSAATRMPSSGILKMARPIALAEVADIAPLLEAQRELALRK